MSEQEQEQTQEQDGPEPDEQATPIQPPDEPAPDEDEEAHEAEEVEGAEGEPEPEQPQARSPREMEERWKRISNSAKVWRKRIPEVFEGDAEMFVPCPLCEPLVPGFVMVTPDTPERFPAVREFMGDAPARELKLDPSAHRCETCDGWGVVDTGSRTQGQSELPCPSCDGFGWTGQRSALSRPAAVPVGVTTEGNGSPPVPMSDEVRKATETLRATGFTLIPPVGA